MEDKEYVTLRLTKKELDLVKSLANRELIMTYVTENTKLEFEVKLLLYTIKKTEMIYENQKKLKEYF